MAIQKTKLIDPIPVDADGISVAQAVGGAIDLTLGGALTSGGVFTGDMARQIGILSAGNDAGITFTVYGTDADNKAITEVVTGSAGAPGTAETTLYFKTVTRIASSAAAAGNVSVGTVDEAVTNTIPLDKYNSDPATISLEDFTGTINVSVDETFSDIQNADVLEWYAVTALASKTSATRSAISTHATGIRVRINSYSSGADLKAVIVQNRP